MNGTTDQDRELRLWTDFEIEERLNEIRERLREEKENVDELKGLAAQRRERLREEKEKVDELKALAALRQAELNVQDDIKAREEQMRAEGRDYQAVLDDLAVDPAYAWVDMDRHLSPYASNATDGTREKTGERSEEWKAGRWKEEFEARQKDAWRRQLFETYRTYRESSEWMVESGSFDAYWSVRELEDAEQISGPLKARVREALIEAEVSDRWEQLVADPTRYHELENAMRATGEAWLTGQGGEVGESAPRTSNTGGTNLQNLLSITELTTRSSMGDIDYLVLQVYGRKRDAARLDACLTAMKAGARKGDDVSGAGRLANGLDVVAEVNGMGKAANHCEWVLTTNGVRIGVSKVPASVDEETLAARGESGPLFVSRVLNPPQKAEGESEPPRRLRPIATIVVPGTPFLAWGTGGVLEFIDTILRGLLIECWDLVPSRVDLCTDFAGVDVNEFFTPFFAGKVVNRSIKDVLYFEEITEWETFCERWTGATRERISDGERIEERKRHSVHRRYRKVTGFRVGGGAGTMLRVYDKIAELVGRDDQKLDLMIHHRWGGEQPDAATRVEFQLTREALRERHDVRNLEDLLYKLRSIADWLTMSWFRLTDEVPDERATQRFGPSELWQTVIDAFQAWTGPEVLKRYKRTEINVDAERMAAQAVGCVAKTLALQGAVIETGRDAVKAALRFFGSKFRADDLAMGIQRKMEALAARMPNAAFEDAVQFRESRKIEDRFREDDSSEHAINNAVNREPPPQSSYPEAIDYGQLGISW